MVALIARRSKYDFWIPGEILTLEIKISLDVKIFQSKNIFGDFWGPKIFSYPKIEIFDFGIGKQFCSQKIVENIFRSKKIHIEKKYFFSEFLFLESKFRQESKNHT